MKKILVTLLVAVLILSVVGCNKTPSFVFKISFFCIAILLIYNYRPVRHASFKPILSADIQQFTSSPAARHYRKHTQVPQQKYLLKAWRFVEKTVA